MGDKRAKDDRTVILWKLLTHCTQTLCGWDPQEASVLHKKYQGGKSRSELETEDAHFLTGTA